MRNALLLATAAIAAGDAGVNAGTLLHGVLSPKLQLASFDSRDGREVRTQRTTLLASGGFQTTLHHMRVNATAVALDDVLAATGARGATCTLSANGAVTLQLHGVRPARALLRSLESYAPYEAYFASLGDADRAALAAAHAATVGDWLSGLDGSMLAVDLNSAAAAACKDVLQPLLSVGATQEQLAAAAARRIGEDERTQQVRIAQASVPAHRPLEIVRHELLPGRTGRIGVSAARTVRITAVPAALDARLVMPIVSMRQIHAPDAASAASRFWIPGKSATERRDAIVRHGQRLEPSADFNALAARLGSSDHDDAVAARMLLLTGAVAVSDNDGTSVIHMVDTDIPLHSQLLRHSDGYPSRWRGGGTTTTGHKGGTTTSGHKGGTTTSHKTTTKPGTSDYFIHNITDTWNPFTLNFNNQTGAAEAEINFGVPSAVCTNCFVQSTLGYEVDLDFCHDIMTLHPKCPPKQDRFTCLLFLFAVDGSIGTTVAAQASNIAAAANAELFYPATYVESSGIAIPLFEPLDLQIAPAFGLGGGATSDNGMPGSVAWAFDVTTNGAQLGFRYDYVNGFERVTAWNPTMEFTLEPSFQALSPAAATTSLSLIPQINFTLTISVAGIIGIGAPLVINPYLYTQLVVTPDSARSGLLPAHQLRGAPARQLQGGCDASDSTYQVNYGCDASLSIGTLSFSIAGHSFDLWDGTELGRASIFGPDPLNCQTCTGCVSQT